ncbi:uncharacterized protein HMPREF1541_09817 [Cyphellophora europaea CBS 101466]|uniref:Heterokaryon incompatibility domain-containing protein n=1 Tax=Cyphellophora europaea (strain CBS 101466) TaxID=1220924 RepID=W2S8E9_CYPE1|nr:uncharacterized protein HMPREF1541_09817 [Cyphellophora europaea CBS 101466]ETN44942.1 hypothetical protein HMPREF1541_09817 [Cyphellophora europaea CBS 101466]
MRQAWNFPTNAELQKPYDNDQEAIATPASTWHTIVYGNSAFNNQRTQVRLLYIGGEGDELVCTLKVTDLSKLGNATPFVALSYTWGTGSKSLIVNDHAVVVTENLFHALLSLRQKHKTVWADALCINQSNIEEKSQQVAHMHTIYSTAREVIVWLGPSDPYSDAVMAEMNAIDAYRMDNGATDSCLFDLLSSWAINDKNAGFVLKGVHRLVKNAEQKLPFAQLWKKLVPQAMETRLDTLSQNLNTKAHQLLVAKKHVVERPYWRRAWIIQELTVARELQILKDLKRLTDDGAEVGWSLYHTQVLRLDSLKSRWKPGEPIHLLEALRACYYTRCGNILDGVYSLTGICFNRRRFVPHIDYETKVENLLQSMTTHHIRSSGSLDVICMQMKNDNPVFSLPSWAPDWRIIGGNPFNHRMISYLTGQDRRQKPHKQDRRWKASGSSTWTYADMDTSGRLLRVRRRVVGKIIWLEGKLPPGKQSLWSRLDKRLTAEIQHNDVTSTVFDTMMNYKERDPVDDSMNEWKHVFEEKALQRIGNRSPMARLRLPKLRDARFRGQTLQHWSNGDRAFTDWTSMVEAEGPSDFSAPKGRKSLDYLKRGADRMIRNDGTGRILPKQARSRRLEAAILQALADEMPLMQVAVQQAAVRRTRDLGEPIPPRFLLGWAHPRAEVEDEICLLEGCTLPVTLRRSVLLSEDGVTVHEPILHEPIFRVVGDAHVTGIMSGEMWPSAMEHKTKPLQDIWLA